MEQKDIINKALSTPAPPIPPPVVGPIVSIAWTFESQGRNTQLFSYLGNQTFCILQQEVYRLLVIQDLLRPRAVPNQRPRPRAVPNQRPPRSRGEQTRQCLLGTVCPMFLVL